MAIIKKNYLVKKRNVLNEIRSNNMTLQELRFFSIYLSKINPSDINTRIVRFPMDDFRAIMELGRINIEYMKNITNSLLSKIVNVPTENGGYIGFQLFKRCRVDIDDNEQWYVEIDAHDEALPLMFDFKDKYFSYQIWNALRLKSPNQLRMYEILKQYEKIGMRILSVEELRNLLGIDKKEYPRFGNFKNRVLDACQKSLLENTDIEFTYESYGKKGKGGKILFLKFTIQKNKSYIDPLTLDKFIEQNKDDENEQPRNRYEERLLLLSDACDNEFTKNEMIVLVDSLNEYLPLMSPSPYGEDITCFNYLSRKYNEMKMRNEKTKVTHRFGYLKSLMGTD